MSVEISGGPSPCPQLSDRAVEVVKTQPHTRVFEQAWEFLRGHSRFLAVAIQFYLIIQLVHQFRLESMTFGRLMNLAFVGFLIHHFLPLRFRLTFFALFSVAATIAVAHLVPGLALLGVGMGLIGICHIPIPFWYRALLLVGCAVGLTALRANVAWLPALEGMWPILGSMFVFRIMIYMYDLKHGNATFSLPRAVSYFFMIPNACFPLFPVIDYKTFCTSYFNEETSRIYQTGIRWMFRGVVQLLLYRLVYHFAPLNIADVTDAKDVAGFMAATYLLYLHVSGQFHLIVGLLHLFGFNLPETHHLYLLASSFTDFWRRINIYWKDFIMKLFFYPAFFALRRMGTLRAITLATLIAFFVTWALHVWQWVWLRGQILLTWQDVSFWCILALLVLANALQEAVSGRRRSLSKPKFGLRDRLLLGLKTIGTFTVICTLWTLWSCQSVEELEILIESAARYSWDDVLLIVAGLAAIGCAGMLWGMTGRDSSHSTSAPSEQVKTVDFWRSASMTVVGATAILGLLLLGHFETQGETRFLAALRKDQLNAGDADAQRRGYYEELDDVRANYFVWGNDRQTPTGWTDESMFRLRDDFLRREMVPSGSGNLCGTLATTNRWGMRDREYEKQKPPDTYRIVLLGSSHEVGSGVKDAETFENLVEDRLNDKDPAGAGTKYEILNLSVGGYGVLRKLIQLERKGFEFAPDAVIFSVNAGDRVFDLGDLSTAVLTNLEIPYDHLNDLIEETGVNKHLRDLVIQRRLQSHIPALYRWAFDRLSQQCSRRGVRVFVLYRPDVIDSARPRDRKT